MFWATIAYLNIGADLFATKIKQNVSILIFVLIKVSFLNVQHMKTPIMK